MPVKSRFISAPGLWNMPEIWGFVTGFITLFFPECIQWTNFCEQELWFHSSSDSDPDSPRHPPVFWASFSLSLPHTRAAIHWQNAEPGGEMMYPHFTMVLVSFPRDLSWNSQPWAPPSTWSSLPLQLSCHLPQSCLFQVVPGIGRVQRRGTVEGQHQKPRYISWCLIYAVDIYMYILLVILNTTF